MVGGKKRDCVFLVEDGAMRAMFQAFLEPGYRCEKLGTGPFAFDAEQDLILGGKNDPGVLKEAHLKLKGYLNTHEHAVVVLDAAFGHHLGAGEITALIERNLESVGWQREAFAVLTIEPELEVWLFQESPRAEDIIFRRCDSERRPRSLRHWLAGQGQWPDGAAKPPNPKEAVQRALRHFSPGRADMLIYAEICRSASVLRCQDPVFCKLREALQRWFPREAVAQ